MFLLDTNVLIEAKNRYYGFDFVPGFWAWLNLANRNGIACSIDAVYDELRAGNDALADWATNNADFFVHSIRARRTTLARYQHGQTTEISNRQR